MCDFGLMPGTIPTEVFRRPPVFLGIRSSKWFIGGACFIATFADGVLYSAIVPLLPFTLVQRSKIHPEKLQSWITILFVVFGCSMILGAPIAGWITQHSPYRQVPRVFGLTAALAATLLFMLAKEAWILVLARCLQGASAGIVFTTVLALLVETVDRDEVGSWLGFALSGVNLGVLAAPVLSGVIYEKAGYYAVFAMCLAIIGFDLTAVLLLIDKKRAQKWYMKIHQAREESNHRDPNSGRSSMDDSGDSRSSGYFGINKPNNADENNFTTANHHPHVDEESQLLVNGSGKAQVSSKRWFPTTRALIGSPQILAALYITFIHSTLHTCFDAVLPRFVQRTFHWSPSGAGLIFLALTLPSLMSPLFGFLSDRYGRRTVALGGFALTVPSLALLGLVRKDDLGSKILLGVLLVLVGIDSYFKPVSNSDRAPLLIFSISTTGAGINLFLTSSVADMSFAVDRLEQEDPQFRNSRGAFTEAYALVDMTFGAGTVFGPLISGLLYEKTTWAITFGVMAAFTFTGSLLAMRYTGDLPPKEDRESAS